MIEEFFSLLRNSVGYWMHSFQKVTTRNTTMTAKVCDVFFVKRRSFVSADLSKVKDEPNQDELKPAVRTMAECLSPLLTGMKVFGLYFKRETGEKSPSRWNALAVYSLVVAIALWINVVRMFSVFTVYLYTHTVVKHDNLSWKLYTA